MQDGCEVYMDSYTINWIMFLGHLDYFESETTSWRHITLLKGSRLLFHGANGI